MHVVVFGLTVSSSWGNGHATLWRSLIKALLRRGHTVAFYEKDVYYYAAARDLGTLPQGATLHLYGELLQIRNPIKTDLDDADLALCTSFCPDGRQACELILHSRAGIKAFYDLDTPVTLDALRSNQAVAYLPERGLGDFDVVLSYTGGQALEELRTRLGARSVAPLYGSVDPETHCPVAPRPEFTGALSYLGTYAVDRQDSLLRLFLKPASCMPGERFVIGGAQYPENFPWSSNITFCWHVPPSDHPAFFCSSKATLNVTREAMSRYGYCPSGRLFEAAACGVPLLTDSWEGLDSFFTPGTEVVEVRSSEDVVNALQLSDREFRSIAKAARDRTLAEHTGDCRVRDLERICESVHGVGA